MEKSELSVGMKVRLNRADDGFNDVVKRAKGEIVNITQKSFWVKWSDSIWNVSYVNKHPFSESIAFVRDIDPIDQMIQILDEEI